MKKNDDNRESWIPALDAAHLIATRFGGLTRAQHALALALREGLLDAGAEEASISESHDADYVEEVAEQGELLCIPREHWSRSEFWDSDRLRWDWELGNFEIHNTETGETYLFDGVFFSEAQVRGLFAFPSARKQLALKQRVAVVPDYVNRGGFAQVTKDFGGRPTAVERADAPVSDDGADRDPHAGIANHVNHACREVVSVSGRLYALRPVNRRSVASIAKHLFQLPQPALCDHSMATSLR